MAENRKLEIEITGPAYDLLLAIANTIDQVLERPDEPIERHASLILQEALIIIAEKFAYLEQALEASSDPEPNEIDKIKMN